eukprot:CAMPEP_0172433246 /NCGR_PEP_ID=MMETSP1064-20121228/67275_1 /TAXON_ID=202472 /ORGANISM="Aulacoseira subarctica , Strain CCAP 1002/5" /LENGTH=225 /DNA_ID=CAMNT_0013181071 /DNA_START=98 /DNA_END=771 /DNA_ORIENTATION=+
MTTSKAPSSRIIYKLLQEHSSDNNNNNPLSSYVRYGAFYFTEESEEAPVSISKWAQTLAASEVARDDFIAALSQTTDQIHHNSFYEAYYFETKGCSFLNYEKKSFEFVLVNAPRLLSFVRSEGANKSAFQKYFDEDGKSCVAFDNLGRDARLIVPKPPEKEQDYRYFSHLATFVRHAPNKEHISQLIQMVAIEFLERLNKNHESTLWLSTSGTGISWLHFRLDST